MDVDWVGGLGHWSGWFGWCYSGSAWSAFPPKTLNLDPIAGGGGRWIYTVCTAVYQNRCDNSTTCRLCFSVRNHLIITYLWCGPRIASLPLSRYVVRNCAQKCVQLYE